MLRHGNRAFTGQISEVGRPSALARSLAYCVLRNQLFVLLLRSKREGGRGRETESAQLLQGRGQDQNFHAVATASTATVCGISTKIILETWPSHCASRSGQSTAKRAQVTSQISTEFPQRPRGHPERQRGGGISDGRCGGRGQARAALCVLCGREGGRERPARSILALRLTMA